MTCDDEVSLGPRKHVHEGTSEVRSSHAPAGVSARFDDPNLMVYGGLAPLVRLAERCGLPGLVTELVRLPASADGTGASRHRR